MFLTQTWLSVASFHLMTDPFSLPVAVCIHGMNGFMLMSFSLPYLEGAKELSDVEDVCFYLPLDCLSPLP